MCTKVHTNNIIYTLYTTEKQKNKYNDCEKICGKCINEMMILFRIC